MYTEESDPVLLDAANFGELCLLVRSFGKCLRNTFPSAIDQDPGAFKNLTVRLVKKELPPHSGRPADEVITRASEIRKAGADWAHVYAECLPPNLSGEDLVIAKENLRAALRARRNRHHKRTKP
jgi:hypothetical protein